MNNTEERGFSGMFWGEFMEVCIPLGKKYYEKFGYVPDIREFNCTQEEFIAALTEAVETGKEIYELLEKAPDPDTTDENIFY